MLATGPLHAGRGALSYERWIRVIRSLTHPLRKTDVVKLIVAVIQPTRLDAVQKSLLKIGVTRMSVCDAHGYARQRGQTEMYRGHEYETNLLRKVALEIAVNDDFLERTIEVLIEIGRTSTEGSFGDGKIFVLPIDEAIQIGGEERGPGAI